MSENAELLLASALIIQSQALENPDIAIPVDPDVAEHMGAFEDTAVSPEDLELD